MAKDCLSLIGKWELPFQTEKVNLLPNYMEFGGDSFQQNYGLRPDGG